MSFEYKITLAQDASTIEMSLPSGEVTELQVKGEDGTERRFINASNLWKAMGSDGEKRVRNFLRSEHGKEQVLLELKKLYENNDLTKMCLLDTFKTAYKEPLPKVVLGHFVVTTRGRFGATWLDENVFLIYAMWLSPELHNFAKDCLKRFGAIHAADKSKQSSMLLDEVLRVEHERVVEERGIDDFEAKKLATLRRDCVYATKSLTDHLQLLYGNTDSDLKKVFIAAFDGLNMGIFGERAQTLKLMLGTRGVLRDFMTRPAVTCISQATIEVVTDISDDLEEGIPLPSLSELQASFARYGREFRDRHIFKNGRRSICKVAENDRKRGSKEFARGVYTLTMEQGEKIKSDFSPHNALEDERD